MYQHQQQQQPGATMYLPPAGPDPVQPNVAYITSPVALTCESYADAQSKVAGIILIIAGALAFIFNVIGLTVTNEIVFVNGHGIWGGVMVSWLIRRNKESRN